MYRGTTPTITFALPTEVENIDVMFITFAQKQTPHAKDSVVIFEKTLEDCETDGKNVRLTLSEEDTLKLSSREVVEIQIRAAFGKIKMASPIYTRSVGRILKEGLLK